MEDELEGGRPSQATSCQTTALRKPSKPEGKMPGAKLRTELQELSSERTLLEAQSSRTYFLYVQGQHNYGHSVKVGFGSPL